MAFHGVGLRAVGFEAGGNVVVVAALWVEPIFEGCAPAAVAEHAAIPDAFEGGDFVVAGSAAGVHGEGWVGAYGDGGDVIFRARVLGHGEAGGGRELVVGVERRRVAAVAAFIGEDLLAAGGGRVELVGVGWGIERVDVEGERVELLVAVAAADFDGVGGSGSFLKSGISAGMKPSKLESMSPP